MFPSQVPLSFSILFMLAFLVPITMVANLVKKGTHKNGFWIAISFYTLYLVIVATASLNGFFNKVMLPPKIVLTTTLPLAIFLLLVYNSKICKKANNTINLDDLVKIHIFRLIGSTFIILFIYDLLPAAFALFAGIGDVLTATLSVFVVRAIRTKKIYSKKLVFLWNTFGFADILITCALAIIFTKISIDNNTLGVDILAEFPFCFIPAFAPPTLIFLHLLVYRKLASEKK